MKEKRYLPIFLFICIISTIAFGQQRLDHVPKDFDLFAEDEVIKITLTYDVKFLLKNRYKDEYQAATMTIYLNDSTFVEKEIRVKPRGEFRRQYCYYPPLKLNFKKTKFENESMKAISSLKLVSKCRGSNIYQQYVLQEYMAYKVYNKITDMSFKARLLEVTTIDSKGKRKPQTSYGFVIEDVDVLAERNNAIEFEANNVTPKNTNLKQAAIVDVFQFMIGNTDYQVRNLHNIKLLKSKNVLDYEPYMVPYDFDYSGIVNTIYAIPAESLGIENVRDRLFRGECATRDVYIEAIDLFKAKEQEILDLYQTNEFLDKANRNASLVYMKDFYEIVNSEVLVEKEILAACK